MKRIVKYTALVTITLWFCFTASAQDSELQAAKQRADSLQRAEMKTALGINDEAVTKVFSIREEMIQKVISVRKNSALTFSEQDTQVAQIRKQTNEQIKAALGSDVYDRYVEMIRKKLKQRGAVDAQPLAGATDN